jgi:hypothetical protein
MNTTQGFHFFGDFTHIFIKLVIAFLCIYALILVLNFLRDKFILKEASTKKDSIKELLLILHKVFTFSGLGFIIASVAHAIIAGISRNAFNGSMGSGNSLNYLVFGILIIFIGLGLKAAHEILDKQSEVDEKSE